MKQELFFVNDIIRTYSEDKENEKLMVNLFKIQDNQYNNSEILIYSELHEISSQTLLDLNIKEGNFIYKSREKEGLFERANNDSRAKREFFRNNILRGNLIQKYITQDEKKDLEKVEQAYSYHINVGHGNCSIIVVLVEGEYKIWIVDCSEYDFRNHTNYRSNIMECFEFIKMKFNLDEIKVDKLFITHPHYDHINGIRNLIRRNYLENTEIWVNLYYSWPDSYYDKLLEELKTLNISLIEPKVSNSNNQIEILYPNNTILRTLPKNTQSYPQYSIVPTNKINNSSVVYKLNLGNKSMIFPGDLEEEGWNDVVNCQPFLKRSTFYCISHHGSITGHRRTRCLYKPSINSVEYCCSDKNINILMGRNGAFPGVFSQQVLDSFVGRLYRTDLGNNGIEPTFLELNWQDSSITYYTNRHTISEVAATIEE